MNNCPRCKVDIADDTVVCPLCHGVLARPEAQKAGADTDGSDVQTTEYVSDGTQTQAVCYPDVQPVMRKMTLFLKIVVFAALLAECAMLIINFSVNPKLKWSLITGVALFYGCFALVVTVLHNRSVRGKILMQLCFGILFMIALDFLLGYQGWSLSFGAPIAIMSAELLLFVLMLVYNNRWQSYLSLQVVLVLISLVFLALAFAGVIGFKVLVYTAAAVCGLALLFMVLFGGRRASRELKQRFQI